MKTSYIFTRHSTPEIDQTVVELKKILQSKAVELLNHPENADLIFVVGGDGAMLEAARKFHQTNSIICGINRGTIGFLASVSRDVRLEQVVDDLMDKRYQLLKRLMIEFEVIRSGEVIFGGISLNDVVVSSPLSVVDLTVKIDGHHFLTMRGSGVLVSTPTGSTAYNLAAHGPILSPDASAIIVTELFDHNVPTPSLVLSDSQEVQIYVSNFRKQNQIMLENGDPADVVLNADGSEIFSLMPEDMIVIRKTTDKANFLTFSDNNFYQQVRDKFNIN